MKTILSLLLCSLICFATNDDQNHLGTKISPPPNHQGTRPVVADKNEDSFFNAPPKPIWAKDFTKQCGAKFPTSTTEPYLIQVRAKPFSKKLVPSTNENDNCVVLRVNPEGEVTQKLQGATSENMGRRGTGVSGDLIGKLENPEGKYIMIPNTKSPNLPARWYPSRCDRNDEPDQFVFSDVSNQQQKKGSLNSSNTPAPPDETNY